MINIKPNYNILKEKEIKKRLSRELNGQMEIKTSAGYIDIVTNSEIIEIKHYDLWKSALVLYYVIV